MVNYIVSITLNIEAGSETDALEKFLDCIIDGDYEVSDIEIESD